MARSANRMRLLDEARSLGITGRHKMNTFTLGLAIENAHRARRVAQATDLNEAQVNIAKLAVTPGGIEALRQALSSKVQDQFAWGDVIRWTASGRYTYAAIKTVAGWFTTAREYNEFVGQTLTFDELLEVLSRSETTNIQVAGEWFDVV